MNELLPEGELLPEETHFKLETLLRAKFLVEATNLITEVKTPWLSISRSSMPANMMLLQHHKKSFSMGKGNSAAASILAEVALPSNAGFVFHLQHLLGEAGAGSLLTLVPGQVPAGEAAEPSQGTEYPQPSRAKSPSRPPSSSSASFLPAAPSLLLPIFKSQPQSLISTFGNQSSSSLFINRLQVYPQI